jgi:hypothetical protein
MPIRSNWPDLDSGSRPIPCKGKPRPFRNCPQSTEQYNSREPDMSQLQFPLRKHFHNYPRQALALQPHNKWRLPDIPCTHSDKCKFLHNRWGRSLFPGNPQGQEYNYKG